MITIFNLLLLLDKYTLSIYLFDCPNPRLVPYQPFFLLLQATYITKEFNYSRLNIFLILVDVTLAHHVGVSL